MPSDSGGRWRPAELELLNQQAFTASSISYGIKLGVVCLDKE
jgi:hypothetical protein